MNKLFGLCAALLTAASALAAPQETSGYLFVPFGHIKQANGTMKDISGSWLPYTVHPIDTQVISAKRSLLPFEPPHAQPRPLAGPQMRTLTKVYQADSGGNYAVIGDEGGPSVNPSTLDDMQLTPAGVGKPWKYITFGFQPDSNHQFLMRWIIYETYNAGAGVNSFGGVPSAASDFGVIYPGADPNPGGGYWIQIDVSAAGGYCDQSQIYLAEQFRDTSDLINGNGAFDTTIHIIYNPDGPPSVGASNNGFWFDYDPTDGKYDDPNEFDVFDTNDPPASYGNILFAIDVNTSTTTNVIQPLSVTQDVGRNISGTVVDMWQQDQSYYVAGPNNTGPIRAPRPIPAPGTGTLNFPVTVQETIEGQAAATTATSYHFTLNAGANYVGSKVQVSFFNWTTNQYDVIRSDTLTAQDALYDYASTNNPAKYVNQSTKRMRARVKITPTAFLKPDYQFRVDQASWTITR